MKESDMEIVKNMTDAKLIVAIRDAVPDAKDTMRAQDICNKKHYAEDRSMLANKQLKAITDTSKFYRRAKAFLLKEIDIKLNDTIFYKCNTINAKNFLSSMKQMVKANRETMEALDALN